MISRTKLLANLTLLIFLSICAETMASPFSDVFVFGDSFSDAGNVATANPGMERPAPYDSSNPPSYYSGGRFLNGPTWVERFATQLGLSASPSLQGGTNYAFGGAKTGPQSSSPPSLLDQGLQFLNTTGGSAPSDALYVIFGGVNDVFQDAFPIAENGGDPSPELSQAASNIESLISDLETAGATNFLVLNLFDLGSTPQISFVGIPTDSATARIVVEEFNDNLSSVLDSLETSLAIDLIKFDLFALFDSILADPASFGFSDTSLPCAFGPAFGGNLCATPDEFLYWDGIHTTAAFHQILADAAINAVPEPAILALMTLGLAGIGYKRGRSRKAA